MKKEYVKLAQEIMAAIKDVDLPSHVNISIENSDKLSITITEHIYSE